MVIIWLIVFLQVVFSTSELLSAEPGIDDVLNRSQFFSSSPTQLRLTLDSRLLNNYRQESWHYDSLLYLFSVRQGVPFAWGGNSWHRGVDCSHFTMKIFQDLGAYYHNYQTTLTMKNITDSNGYYRVPIEEARFGDMLVYGTFTSPEEPGKWFGHVVILVDKDFVQDDFRGLVIGSHGEEVGVKFISYKGFPLYYRRKDVRLYNVLRNRALAEHAN